MDLNYLYQRHQVALFRADNAACGHSRNVHNAMADAYASRIARSKSRLRLVAA